MNTHIATAFTERFQLRHPVALAPMDLVSGGALAAAVSRAGGLGLIGGGYGNTAWLAAAFEEARPAPVGVGFITWSALQQPDAVELAFAANPSAFMVSFGDAEPLIDEAKARGIPTLWQVQRLEQARQALAADVDVIVVQGQEAGGHGMDRGLMTLVPAVRALAGPERLILAAGGIADGCGLAAALMLGADGVLLGTRLWASEEAAGPVAAKARMCALGGDETVRTKVFDVARDVNWPEHFRGRVVNNAFCDEWHGDLDGLKRNAKRERARYNASAPTDFDTRVLIAGEALDLIDTIEPAGVIIERMVTDAARRLDRAPRFVTRPVGAAAQ